MRGTKYEVVLIARTLVTLLALVGAVFGQGKETALWSFGGEGDGSGPYGRLVFDNAGNLYGTTTAGGSNCQSNGGCGIVFELSPSSSGWTEAVLYNFCADNLDDCPDGSTPFAGLTFDRVGNLYGTTETGGVGFGTVFELSPPSSNRTGLWTETVLFAFQGSAKQDGAFPYSGTLNWDPSGNLYGTTTSGGSGSNGTVFKLSPQLGGGWKETILHRFKGSDGASPEAGVAIDNSGNLYGTTKGGGPANAGVLYRLSPNSQGTWTETVLYAFDGLTGANPMSAVSIDHAGNLYGTFLDGGEGACVFGACGGVFKLARGAGGGLSKHFFLFDGKDGGNPMSGVLIDNKTGAVFGTTWNGNNVYEIEGEKETVLYQFCSQPNCADGSGPAGGLLTSRGDVLYGVTTQGGARNYGVVFMLSQ